MRKIGFIGEGSSETIILNSTNFQKLLENFNLECVGVFDASGGGNLNKYNAKINSFFEIFEDREAEKIIVVRDLEDEPCSTALKQKMYIYNDNKFLLLLLKQ